MVGGVIGEGRVLKGEEFAGVWARVRDEEVGECEEGEGDQGVAWTWR